jgi:hypothetical protein
LQGKFRRDWGTSHLKFREPKKNKDILRLKNSLCSDILQDGSVCILLYASPAPSRLLRTRFQHWLCFRCATNVGFCNSKHRSIIKVIAVFCLQLLALFCYISQHWRLSEQSFEFHILLSVWVCSHIR